MINILHDFEFFVLTVSGWYTDREVGEDHRTAGKFNQRLYPSLTIHPNAVIQSVIVVVYQWIISFLCRLRSIATHRDHFVWRLSVCLSVR